jgi:hypothetical protein
MRYIVRRRFYKTSSSSSWYEKPTTPGVPRRSPIQILSWPDDASLLWSDENRCVHRGVAVDRVTRFFPRQKRAKRVTGDATRVRNRWAARALHCFYRTPQAWAARRNVLPGHSIAKSQIKNIKLLIVTDIKVSTDSSSLSGFRLGWGRARLFTKKSYTKNCTIVFRHVREKIVPNVGASLGLTCRVSFLTPIFFFSANFYVVWKKDWVDLVKNWQFYDGQKLLQIVTFSHVKVVQKRFPVKMWVSP